MIKKQSGLTLISWVIIISLAGIQLVFAMRIIPVYLDFATVKSIMNDVQNKDEHRSKSPRDMLIYIRKTLDLNNMYELQKQKDAFKFRKTTDGLELNLHYESRGPIIGNLDFVATFEHQILIPRSKNFRDE
ncbi:MAG: DUF4845 domain-containing protein [Gammaproteobacteria bacterium]|nr:DUF4845 domain-containing protein [Gammaproteobacteria bacterium]